MLIRHALRRLAKAPAFTAIAVLTLALGIGANGAIFSVVNGILLKPLRYVRPEELVEVDHAAPGVNMTSAGAAPFLYFTYRERSKTFRDVGLWRPDTDSVTGVGEPEEIRTVDVTDGMLPILGVRPLLGRLFTRADDAPGGPETMILSNGYWRSRFGADPKTIGRRVTVDGRAREVIGVLPATFRFLDRDAAALMPLRLDRSKVHLGNFSYQAVARLASGVTLEQAAADAGRLIPVAIGSFPPFPGYSAKMFADARLRPALKPLKQSLVGEVGSVLWVLMGTIGLVLLIACANVANLLLVRTSGRQHELAVRAALGAGWGRIARELMVESLVLGLLGGALGLGLAWGGVRLLIAIAPANLPRLGEITIDGAVLLFTFVISLLAAALFGAIPVFKFAGPQLGVALRAGGRTLSDGKERNRARNTLVVAQVALALVLLVASGLMIRTFRALRHVEPGFARPDEVLTLYISIPSSVAADGEPVVRLQQRLAERIAAVPGVSSVGLTTTIPMDGSGWNDPVFTQDKVYAEGQLPPMRRFKFIAPGLLKTMGNPLIAGRDLTWDDVYAKRRVVLVSQNLARELWHDPASAIGKRVRETLKSPWREVIGVVGDERTNGVDREAPTFVCWPLLIEDFEGDHTVVQRTIGLVIRSGRAGSSGLVSEVGRAVWSVNPSLPLANVHTLREIYDKSLARTSFTVVMLSIASVMALLLGIAGLYGVIAYAVSQRTREIGIRMALGARHEMVTRMFVGQGLRLAAAGIVFGVAGAVALTRLMASLLFAVSPVDPLTYAGVTTGLVSVAMLASYLPALRAATVDPVAALRAE
jgi:predicted permease